MNISFIGFGNMAQAIAQRWVQIPDLQIRAAAPSLLEATRADGIQTTPDNLAILPQAEIVLLAVKPNQMPMVMQQISPHLSPASLVISIAAGITLQRLNQVLPTHTAIIRAMPNIAALIGESATPLLGNTFVSESQKTMAETLFKAIGVVTWAQNDRDIDSFTALSGSGPAYVFLFLEALIEAAETLGLTPDVARTFALQTVRGAANLACQSSSSVNQLRQSVTSSGGTTAAALQVLQDYDFSALLLKAMQRAKQRAEELGA